MGWSLFGAGVYLFPTGLFGAASLLGLLGSTLLEALFVEVPEELFVIIRPLNRTRGVILRVYLLAALPRAGPECLPHQDDGGHDEQNNYNATHAFIVRKAHTSKRLWAPTLWDQLFGHQLLME